MGCYFFKSFKSNPTFNSFSRSISNKKVKKMEEQKTGYQWCLEENISVSDMHNWNTEMASCEESYYTEKVSYDEFLEIIQYCKIEHYSTPKKTTTYLTYRMYGLVAYQLCGTIHAGIQFGHAVVDYGRSVSGLRQEEGVYNKWADKDKTFIVLNGGTTNSNPERLGTLNQHLELMEANEVLYQAFHEPDLGDQLTAIAFLVDERVFDKVSYPDYEQLKFEEDPSYLDSNHHGEEEMNYNEWVKSIGGAKNAFLREFLKQFRFA
jgi:hypothetical protein